jgi:histidinol-phosphatase
MRPILSDKMPRDPNYDIIVPISLRLSRRMSAEILSEYLEFATETAYLAGRLTLGYYQVGLQPETKSDHSPVTIADRKSEELIRSRIEKRYPTHAIIGEEFGILREQASLRWFIDPIDGTKSFVRGVPLFAVLIGLEIEGQVKVGVAYFPALDEMLTAASGLGCWWNGRRARVSLVASLDQAVFTTTSAYSFAKFGCQEIFDSLAKRCYFQAGWGDAYGYMLVATGRAELMVDPAMSVWDCAPFPPILSEAGGFFGDWEGRPVIDAGQALAVNSILLPEVLALIHPPAS